MDSDDEILFNDLINFSSDEKTNEQENRVENISDIIKYIDGFIKCSSTFSDIKLMVEVMEMRDYNGLIFLKIADKTASIKAVIYSKNYQSKLAIGDKIDVICTLCLYRGELQLVIKSYKPIGKGDNNTNLLKLKKELAELGYFDKKPVLENNYSSIGVISSLNAAGLKDFIHTISQRCCAKTIYIYPSLVQGTNAPADVEKAIELANAHNKSEILVLIRGGGSKEDLECFNSKRIATAIFRSKLPIVTGIGHQIDVSIADLTACKSFITPTAVAQNITKENIISKQKVEQILNVIRKKLIGQINIYHDYLKTKEEKLEKYRNIWLNSLNEQESLLQQPVVPTEQKIILSLVSSNEYIIKREEEIDKQISIQQTILNDTIEKYKQYLSYQLEKTGHILKNYEDQIHKITLPHIISKKTGKEIISLNQMEKENIVSICFIDGSYDLKLS